MLRWYDGARRELPWRESADFYRVWISEIMLQQTRVEAVVPYYVRFLERFPDVNGLARADESEVLAAWSGLGYYRRARQLHLAARRIAEAAAVPRTHAEILALPGCGAYTAAAIASIALGLPHAAVDGNVARAIARLSNGEGDTAAVAAGLLDPRRPGDFNQAMMELGATICTPRAPDCAACPVRGFCGAYKAGAVHEIPRPKKKPEVRDVALDIVVIEEKGRVFLVRRAASEGRMADFWELPRRSARGRKNAERLGRFRHRIVNDRIEVTVWRAAPDALDEGRPEGRWFTRSDLKAIPLTTIARKALSMPLLSTGV